MKAQYSLTEIVSRLGGELVGDGDIVISRVASLANAQNGHISFITDSKYRTQLAETAASAIIISEQHRELTTLPRIVTDNPYAYFARVSDLLNPRVEYVPGISPNASVASDAIVPASCTIMDYAVIATGVELGEGVVIGAGCVVGRNVHIGSHTVLQAHVTIYADCQIGQRCVMAAGVVIGADGFGYANDQGRWVKIPQVGRVIIADDVEIGANTSVDRGALDDTIIEQGVKLDNLIQIGHNCRIGAHTVIAGCVGIAGSAIVGKHCRIGGAAMILGHLEIADGVTISPGSMITRSLLKSDTYTALMPFQTHGDWLKTAANIRRLGDMSERVKQLENELAQIRAQLDITNRN
ncbi:UDP-3-O-(3-hydroxymyristoyl)glucosamine N-acyltransferase [Methylovorus menthalis]|uniref:UDP-3-O-(3-hydroxymyristoyl)glucosamine N-acyltransferase n=1 Tax=Methylovorus menthalis TaxID=1002227 RepID=UPI001E576407|nr:UDP-3-O-(3-hydroxymyristoyl)glucosamine N-acyltransferase [Methylovorus menthalis]MCB4811733.1 UDP-3-O-(3-hydroxymyristoyl)glucosamine N-acyltransferase [Methylovorus menthalis]